VTLVRSNCEFAPHLPSSLYYNRAAERDKRQERKADPSSRPGRDSRKTLVAGPACRVASSFAKVAAGRRDDNFTDRDKAPPFAAQRMGHPGLLEAQPDGRGMLLRGEDCQW
jgi:hypothetical protein